MKAIETIYKGYKFRSRLEARWAVFLDALKWEWEYEKEGYVFEDGTKYLPDFYLPELKTWIEIKPENVLASEIEKCKLLSKGLGEEYFVALASGMPEPKSLSCFCNGERCSDITITTYIRTKGWNLPYFGSYWDDDDMPCFDVAKSARFEHGESGATVIIPEKKYISYDNSTLYDPPKLTEKQSLIITQSLDDLRKEFASSTPIEKVPLTEKALKKAWSGLLKHLKDHSNVAWLPIKNSTCKFIDESKFEVIVDTSLELKLIESQRTVIQNYLTTELKNKGLWMSFKVKQ